MRKCLLSLLAVFFVALSAHSVNVILSEGFENGLTLPAGWTLDTVSGNAVFNWTVEDATQTSIAPQGAAEGTNRVAMRNSGNLPKNCTMRLITPVLDCSGYLPRLSFAHAQPMKSGKNAQLKIYYRSSQNDSWTLMTSYTDAINDWQRDTMNLVAPNNTYQLAFEAVVTTSGAGYGVVLDDIRIETTPQCTDVQGLSVVPMANSAELTIGDLAAVSFQVAVTTQPVTDWDTFDPTQAVFYDPNVLDLVVTVTGLQPQTDYYAYVRSACADLPSGFTNWISASFRTSIGFPFAENFESIAAIPDGWQRMSGDLLDVYSGTALKTTTGGWNYSGNATVTGSAHIYSTTSTTTTYWMVMPAIDLTTVPADTMIDLEFYLALTSGSTSASAVTTKTGLNFYVLVSEDAGQTWSAGNTTTWSAAADADFDIEGVMNVPSRYRVNMNRYKGQVVQVAFVTKANSGSGYFHVDNITLASYDPQCGDAAKLHLTADMNAVTASWTMYGKENALIEIATDNAFAQKVDSAVITTGTTYTFTNLTSNTVYYVRVKQDCPDASWVYGSCRTVIGMPYTNPFTSTTFPAEWSRDNTGVTLQQLLGGTPLALTSTSGWSMSAASTSFPNMGARAYTNIYGTSRYNWMVSPAIKLTDASNDPIRLSFMAALSKSSSSATAPVFTKGDNDDVFAVLISQDGGLTWLAADAHIWDTDSASTNQKLWDFTQSPQKMNIDLTQYRGQTIRVAFYGGSTASGSDNYMMVGNLSIATFDANCGGISGLNLNTTPNSVTATWSTSGYTNVDVQLSKSATFATLEDSAVVNNGTIQFSNLTTNTQYYIRVRQQCSTDDSDWATKAFKTPVGLPFVDALTNLTNWTKMSGIVRDVLFSGATPTTTTSGWSTSTARHIEGIDNDTHASYNLYSTSYNYWLVSTPINMYSENGDPIQLEFDFGITEYSSTSDHSVANQMLWVLVSTDNGDTWTRANSYLISAADSADYNINNCYAHAVHFKLPLTQYSGQTIVLAFAANQYTAGGDNYVHLANINIHTIDANCQGLSAIRATNITGTSADIEWTAGGAQSLDLTVATDTAFSQIVYTGAVTATYSLTNLTPNTRYYVKARQTCDTGADWTLMMFKTLCAPQTPDALGVMTFDNEASADCWMTGFVTTGSTSQYSYAGWAQLEKFGGIMALAKQGVNSEETTYNDGAYAILPELNIGNDTITRYQVIFDAATYASYATNVGRIQVGIVTSPDQLDTYEQLKTINLEYAMDSSVLSTYVVNFADYQGDYNDEYGKYIMFKSEAGADSLNYVLIDNVSVSLADGCPQLVEQDIVSLRTDSALFRWENVAANSYEVMVSPFGGRADTITAESLVFQGTTAADSIWITGLTGNTRYYAYVRAVCTDGMSRWSGAKAFRTECDAIRTFPWSEDFETMETGVIDVDCWDMFQYAAGTGSGTSGKGFQISSSTMSGNATNKLYLPDMPAGEMTQLTLPVMYGTAAPGQYELVIDVLRNGSGSKNEGLHIYASPDGSMAKAVEMAFIYRYFSMADSAHNIPAESASDWYTYELTIPISGYFHIIIMGESQWGSATYADNIIIRQKAACPRPVFKPVSNITTTSVDLAWGGSTAGTYEVQYSMDSEFGTIDGTQMVNNDSTVSLTGLQPGTTYYARVRGICTAEDQSEWSRVITAQTAFGIPFIETFNLSALPSTWTIMTGSPQSAFSGTAPASSSAGWKIMTSSYGLPANHLAINIWSSTNNRWIVAPTLDMTSTVAGDSLVFSFDFAYTNFSSDADIDAGSDQSLWLLVSLDGGQTWDFQNSYVWTNSDTAAVNYSIANIPTTGTHINLDFSRFAGQTVRFAFVATTKSGDNDFHIANVQLIKVLAGCDAPSMVSVEPDTYSASVMWNGDSTKTTVIQLSTVSDFTKDIIYDTISNGLEAVVTGLEHSSVYYVRVKQLCGGTDETVWSSSMNFRTNCVAISSFPWLETFENTPTTGYQIPNCWERIAYRSSSTSSTIYPYVYSSSSYATSGTHVLYMYGGSSSSKEAIILPEVAVSLNTLVLRFNYRMAYATASYAKLVLGTISDPTDITTFTALDTLPVSTTMTDYEFYLNNVDSTARRLAFALLDGTSIQTVYLDDISLDYLPACYDVKTLRVSNITPTTACARLIPTEASQYEYLLADRAITPATMDSAAQTHVILDSVAGDSLALTGLQSAKTYYMYVRALCDDSTASAWSKAVPFTTECYPIATLPYNEGFESYQGGAYNDNMAGPTCWNTYTTGTIAPHVISSGMYYYTHGGSKALTFYGSGYNYAVMPKFEAPIGAMRMTFWMQVENTSYGTLELGYITDEDVQMSTYTQIATFASSSSMAQRSVDLSNVPATASRLVFRWYWSSQYSCCIDDIQITERPSNETLLNISVDNVTRTSMDIAWTPRPDSTLCANYELVISTTALNNAALDTVPRIIVTDTTGYHASLLDRDTPYFIYARTACDSVYGVWVSVNTRTLPMAGCGDGILIAEGSSTSSSLPLYGLWLDSDNFTQSIYPASMLTELRGKRISSIQYFLSSGSTVDTEDYGTTHVSVGITTQTTVPNGFLTDPKVEVYSGEIVASEEDGMTITFNQPIMYQGGNIFIEFDHEEAPDYESMSFMGMTGTSGCSRYQYDTNSETSSSFLPMILVSTICDPSDLTPCPAIDGITSELQGDGTSEAIIRWATSNADYANGYDLFFTDNDSIVPDSMTVPQFVNLTDTFVTINTLEAYTIYHVFVRVHCNAGGHEDGDSEWAEYVFQTLSTCPTVLNLNSVLTSKTTAEVTWNPAYEGQPADYRYIVSTTELTDAELIAAVPATDNTLHLYLTDLTLDQQYWVYVASACTDELSPWLMTTFTTPANCAPVENLTIVSLRHNMVTFSWERSRFGTETMWEIGIVGDSTNMMQTSDTVAVLFGLREGTGYSLYVKALCDEGETSVMTTLAFTTAAAPLPCIELGTGTTKSSTVPFNNYYKNSWTQAIYTAEEIGRGGELQSIWYHSSAVHTSGTFSDSVLTIYVAHTSMDVADTTDWIPEADLVQVYVAAPFDHPVDTGWFEIPLQAPFRYNGTDNLAIVIGRHAPAYSGSQTYYCSAVPSGRVMYRRSDTDASCGDYPADGATGTMLTTRANAQFCFEEEACARPMELRISDLSYYSARATWAPGSNERSWETYLSAAPMTDEELDSVAATVVTNPMLVLSDLNDDVDYWFYVRGLCDSTHTSGWASVHFLTMATCLPPAAIVSDSVTADQAWLHITSVNAEPAQGYTVIYGPAATFDADDAATYTAVQAGDTLVTLNGLTDNTLYKVAVMEVCNPTHTSRISPVSTFRTDCAPVAGLPWGEDFNKLTSGIPDCWDNSIGNATTPWAYNATGQTGNCVRFNSYSNTSGQIGVLMSPELTIDTTATLIFSYKNPTGGNFRVAVTTDNGVTNTTLLNNLVSASSWVEREISLNAYRGQVIRIYFEGTSNYGNGDAYIYLDDVSVIIPSPCERPDNVTAEVVGHDVLVSWTGSGVANSDYLVECSTSSTFASAVDSILVHDTTSVTVTGLAGDRTYYFRVRSICGEYGESRISAVATAKLGIWMPYVQDTTFTSLPANWKRSNTTMTDAFNGTQLVDYSGGWSYAASNAVMHGSHFKINIYGTTSCHHWLRMPELEISANANQSAVLTFDLALNKYGSSNIGVAPIETGEDDIFLVAISTDGGKHFTRASATIWQDAPGANYSYAAIPANTVATYRVDLSAYIGQNVVIGFYGESTVGTTSSGGDNDLHLGNIRVEAMAATRYDDIVCDGNTYNGYGFTIAPSQYHVGTNYFSHSIPATDTTEASYELLRLEVLPLTLDTLYATVCEGDAYVYDERVYLEEGDVTVGRQEFLFELTSMYGCDSVVLLIVDGLPASRTTEYASTCNGIPYNWHGQDYYIGGTYVDTLRTIDGCDSICTLLLTVEDVIRRDTAVTLCYGEQLVINGQTITTSGVYKETIDNPDGCDEEVNWYVTAIGKLETHTRVVACKGTTYNDELIHGLTQDFHGNTTTTSKVSGCDSTVIYDIWFADANETLYVNVPENELPFSVNGVELIAAGTAQGEYTRTISTDCGDVTMVISVGQAVIRYTVTVKAENGLAYGSGVYVAGEQVEIRVQPFEGYRFKSWNDGNTDNPRTITVNADVTYTGTCEIIEGLEEVIRDMNEDDVLKLIENQQLIIIRGGVRYNAQGAVIE